MVTRANFEVLLIARGGKLMEQAGLDGKLMDGNNGDLNDPLGFALRQIDITVGDITAIVDADFASVGTDDIDKVLDFAEYRLLGNIVGNLDVVDFKIGSRSESRSQLSKQVEVMRDKAGKRLADTYGFGLGEMDDGIITLDFAEHDDDTSN